MATAELKIPEQRAFTDEEIATAEKEADKCGDRFTTEQMLPGQASIDQASSPYQVIWLPSARPESQQGSSPSELVQTLGRLLGDSPTTYGEQLLGRARLVALGSWQVLYRVDEPDKLVTILAAKQSN
jgi:hypothetical protein